jgi:Flp pilus assembly secretin CpaC
MRLICSSANWFSKQERHLLWAYTISRAFIVALITLVTIGSSLASGAPLREFKNTVVLDLRVSQSRLFNTQPDIVRTCISDPAVAEPIVIARDQVVLLGRAPGRATLEIWNSVGNMVGIEVRVAKDGVPFASRISAAVEAPDPRSSSKTPATRIPKMNVGAVSLEECKMTAVATADYQQTKAQNILPPSNSAPPRLSPTTRPKVNGDRSEKGKTSMIMDLEASQLRTFRLPRPIVKTSISDPAVGELILLSATDLEVLGKAPGKATLMIVDDKQNVLGIDLRVRSDHDAATPGDAPILPVVTGSIQLEEYQIDKVIDLEVSQPKMFNVKKPIVRVAMSDPAIADLFPGTNAVYLVGNAPGIATFYIWDDDGNVSGIKLRVGQAGRGANKTSLPLPLSYQPHQLPTMKIEYWTGDKKYVRHRP